MGPPDDTRPGVVALELTVARSDRAAVLVESASAYPTGVELALEIRWRDADFDVFHSGIRWYTEGGELPDELVRFGVQLPDGSKATTLGTGASAPVAVAADAQAALAQPTGPRLVQRGGAGSSRGWSQALWLWPLPPEGQIELVCEWPALGIALTRTPLETAPILDAARRSEQLWG
jgi:hypothetical protein